MHRLCIFLSVVMMSLSSNAQVLINLQLAPSGLTVKSQLWNFALVNTGTSSLNVKVEVVMKDAATNQQVLTGTSKMFVLHQGLKQIQYADVTPVVYTVNNTGYGIDASPDGFLPVGVFIICFNVIKYVSDVSENLTQECETVEIEPISPPILVMPADSDHVETTRPFFSWTPPVPFNFFSNLLYDWVLVEVQATQTGATAVQQNFPLLQQSNINTTSLQYPLGSPELDSTKLYAWQVTAKNNTNAIGKSEVWTFRVNKFGVDTTTYKREGYFVKLIPRNEGLYAVCQGVVRYEYVNEINDTSAAVRLYDLSSPANTEVVLEDNHPSLKFGQNFIKWDLTNRSGIVNKRLYLLELTNSKREKWYMKFEYRDPQQ